MDPGDAYAGVDCNSVSFLNIITAGDILGKALSFVQLFSRVFGRVLNNKGFEVAKQMRQVFILSKEFIIHIS